VGERCWAGTEGEALAFEGVGQLAGISARGRRLHPCAAERLVSVPSAHWITRGAVAHCEEVAKQPGCVRQRRDGVTLSAHHQSSNRARNIGTRSTAIKAEHPPSIGTCSRLDAPFFRPDAG